jgi:hypothetical protein
VKAIIHIGGEKTGTTTIQAFCARNRAVLAERGILYPSSAGASNHLGLAAYALDDDTIDDIRQSLNLHTRDQLDEFRKRLRADLSNEVAQIPNISTMLLSNEHLHSRLLKHSEIRRLHRLVSDYATQITVLLYIRRQDRVAVSHYSTRLKSDGFTDEHVFPTVSRRGRLPAYYDYDAVLARYEKIFGAGNIVVRLFEPARFVDGDLVRDFLHACDIRDPDDFATVERQNESLSDVGIKFFKRFNPRVPRFVHGRPNPYRRGVDVAVTKHHAGEGPAVSTAEAKTFYEKFAISNRAVQARYFPAAKGPLFDEDFSRYDQERAAPLGEDELIDLAVDLWIERTSVIEMLRLENALLRFQAAIREGRDRPPPTLPEISIDETLPAHLMFRYLGALLYMESYRKAADVTAVLLEQHTAPPVVQYVHACALAGLGDQARVEGFLNDRASAPRVRTSLETIARAGLTGRPIDHRMAFFKSGAMSHTRVYSRCLAWLDASVKG